MPGFIFRARDYMLGLSASQLFGSSIKLGQNKFEDYKTLRHFYLVGGYKWLVSHTVVLEPSFLARATIDAYLVDAT